MALGKDQRPGRKAQFERAQRLLLSIKIDMFYDDWRKAQNMRLQFERQYPQRSAGGGTDLTKASAEDLRTYLGLLTAESQATHILLEWDRNIQGAEDTIRSGDLRLEAILTAERKSSAALSTPTSQ
jgi:hypothetical protein